MLVLTTLAEKYVLALRCLNAALTLDSKNSRVTEQAKKFDELLKSKAGSLPPKVAEVLKAEFKA